MAKKEGGEEGRQAQCFQKGDHQQSTTAASKTRAENWSQAVTRMELATCSSLVTFDKSSFKGVVEAKVLVKMGSSKELHTNVQSSFIHNTYNLETVQVFANR